MKGYTMCYLLAVLAATGCTAIFMLYASMEAGKRGLAIIPGPAPVCTSVRQRLGYEEGTQHDRHAALRRSVQARTAQLLRSVPRPQQHTASRVPLPRIKLAYGSWEHFQWSPATGGIFTCDILSRYPKEVK